MGSRIYGIDYLRGILSILVVIWHMGGGGYSLIFSKDHYLSHSFAISDFINFHVLLTAVPCFILVSNFLFVSKKPDLRLLWKHLGRLFLLATFWPITLILYRSGMSGLTSIFTDGRLRSLEFLVMAGNTVYYFFVSLMLTQMLAYIIVKLTDKFVYAFFLVSIAVLLFTPSVAAHYSIPRLSAYWNPLNFIAPSLCAICLVRLGEKISEWKYVIIAACAAMTVILAAVEWKISVSDAFFVTDYSALPAYARPSVTFTSALFMVVSLSISRPPGLIFQFMSNNSLALYCIHPFLIVPVNTAVTNLFGASLPYLAIVLVIVLSYLLSVILKFYLRGEVIGKITPRPKTLTSNAQGVVN